MLFDDLGLTPAEGLPEDFGENVSIEGLVKYNPDHIIDITYFNSGEFYDTVTKGEVWNSLKAVKIITFTHSLLHGDFGIQLSGKRIKRD